MTINLTTIRELAVRAKEMADAATLGPWSYAEYDVLGSDGLTCICTGNFEKDDMAFIASSRTVVPELADAVLGLLEENKTALKQHYELCCEIERAKAQYEALKAENAKLRAVAEARCRHLPDALAALDEEPHEKDHY